MKFLCDNCKAKYQIPDGKIAGRTLRMKCRKCGHNIIIRGPKGESKRPSGHGSSVGSSAGRRPRSSGSPTGRRRTVGSQSGPRPQRKSSLGAEFRRSTAGSIAPEAPPRQVAEWYVAINDVPVGPIKREEVARKIGTGAVEEESLCWREGFDDWLPVKLVPELMSLLKQRRVATPPLRPSSRPGSAAPPERSNVVPIGGRLGAAAAPALEEFELDEKTVMAPLPAMAPAAVAPPPAAAPAPPVVAPIAAPLAPPIAVPPPAAAAIAAPLTSPVGDAFQPAPAPALAQPRRIPVGAWIAMVGAGCFGMAFAVVLANKMLADDPAPIAELAPVQDPIVDPHQVEAPIVVDPTAVETETAETVETVETPEVETPAIARTTMTATMRATTMTATMSEVNLTPEQRRVLERLRMDTGDEAPMITQTNHMSTGSMRPVLDAAAVRRVVTARSNTISLQRCYNRAIRGMGDPPSVRLDVNVRVGASGSVTRVSARGNDLGGLKACVEQQVRRWRFPPSSAGGETSFPVVFSAPN